MSLHTRVVLLFCGCLFAATIASAQVQTGSITGTVTDSSGALLPGVTVSLSGEKLIGGVQSQITTGTGDYRFDRLPPGAYTIRFELQGFKTVERADLRVSASFVATVNAKLEVGQVAETITVSGASPTIDTKSNVQQIVMNQEILEGVPTGRDPWSLAKIVPGVQISSYDVGGTQSIQQSSLSAHGSSINDVSYKIDGATVNWPGNGGGSTMIYYDQGMFEEVNYQTSSIPAEVMVGGVSINMVTKEAGNRWRGGMRYAYANDSLQSDNWSNDPTLQKFKFIGNPTTRLYDVNLTGGGAIVKDRVWFTGSLRRWVVDKLTNAKNADGSRAVDDNTLKNYSAKGVWQATLNQKFAVAYNHNNKVRGHRRDAPPDFVPDVASLLQLNPGSTTQVRYTGIRKKLVLESSYSAMLGETDYEYQPGTPATAIRVVDPVLSTATVAAARREELPNSRIQFDNSVSYSANGLGGDHLLKAGVQFARIYMNDQFWVNGDMYLAYNNGKPTSVTIWNTPTANLNIDKIFGIFAQDSWTVGSRLTMNLGVRFDNNRGILPAQSNPAGTWVPARSIPESEPINQNLFAWRSGVVFDPAGAGKTALKASYSRYALQVGIDRVQNANPFRFASASCPWTDPNGDGQAQSNEIGTCSGFPTSSIRYAGSNGPRWPYSDEVTAGIEQQIAKDLRLGVMYYHRTNRDQVGMRNLAVPNSAYTPVTVTVPGSPTGPGGTATVYNLKPPFLGLQTNVLDNEPYLNTDYNGVELTANKRFSDRWQMVVGFTAGKLTGGLNDSGASAGTTYNAGQLFSADLNDPNNTAHSSGIVGYDSKYAFRLAGSYHAPWDLAVSGSLISNTGFPYVSTYSVNRSVYPSLTRASQTVILSDRGDERLPAVTMLDLRISRAFKFAGNLQIVPQVDVFNIGNASTIARNNPSVGSAYLSPAEIMAPRIVRVGFNLEF